MVLLKAARYFSALEFPVLPGTVFKVIVLLGDKN